MKLFAWENIWQLRYYFWYSLNLGLHSWCGKWNEYAIYILVVFTVYWWIWTLSFDYAYCWSWAWWEHGHHHWDWHRYIPGLLLLFFLSSFLFQQSIDVERLRFKSIFLDHLIIPVFNHIFIAPCEFLCDVAPWFWFYMPSLNNVNVLCYGPCTFLEFRIRVVVPPFAYLFRSSKLYTVMGLGIDLLAYLSPFVVWEFWHKLL